MRITAEFPSTIDSVTAQRIGAVSQGVISGWSRLQKDIKECVDFLGMQVGLENKITVTVKVIKKCNSQDDFVFGCKSATFDVDDAIIGTSESVMRQTYRAIMSLCEEEKKEEEFIPN